MQVKHDVPLRKQLFTIPNLLGYLRIILVPVIIWRYVTADSVNDYYAAALIVVISSISDLFDGMIARKFNQITQLGKALDPIADKLTQAAMVLCLTIRYNQMIPMLILFVVKEGFMGIMGALMLRKGKMLDGAMWYGKVCTAVLYIVMFMLFLFPELPVLAVNICIGICVCFMLLSFVLYIPAFIKLNRE